jgi:hypothetical protein
MPATYEPIATYTCATAQTTINFTSIPATYTDLVLAANFSFTNATTYPNPRIQLNADTVTAFPLTGLYGTGTVAGSYRLTGYTYAYISASSGGATGNDKFAVLLNFQDYKNTTTYKPMLYRVNANLSETTVGIANWLSTNAITSIEWSLQSNSYAIGSTFTLYGIKAAA